MDQRETLMLALTNGGTDPRVATEMVDAFAAEVRRVEMLRCARCCGAAAELWPDGRGKPALDAMDYILGGGG